MSATTNGGCPTCSHTMAVLTVDDSQRYQLCDRCGTVVAETKDRNADAARQQVYVPKLVERCREFERTLHSQYGAIPEWLQAHWHGKGIRESINRPEDRP